MRVRFLVAAFGLALLFGCDPSPPPKAKPASAPSGGPVIVGGNAPASTNATSTSGAGLTDAQAQVFVDRVIQFVNGQIAVDDFLDVNAAFTKVAQNVGYGSSDQAQFVRAATASYESNSITKSLRSEVAKGGKVRFLRFSQRNNTKTALFRLILPQGGISYIEFALQSAVGNNPIQASDFYQYSTAEWFTETSTSAALQLKATTDPNALSRLFKGAVFGASDGSKLLAVIEASRAQNWQAVLAKYAELPPSMKQSKFCLMLRFNAAGRLLNEAEIAATVEELQKHFPGDPCVDFVSIDFYALRNEPAKSVAAIDNLDRLVGGDPFLDLLRAGVYLRANDAQSALTAAKRLAVAEPEMAESHWAVARSSQKVPDFAATAAAFKKLQSLGVVTPQTVASNPEFGTFVASAEFQAWQADR